MALRRSLHLLGGARARAFSSDAREAFNSAFAKVAPLLDAPHFGSDNLTRPEPAEGAIPEKLTLNFFKPHGIEFKATEVTSVQIPAAAGDFGVLPGHAPTVAQLRPGVLTVTVTPEDVRKYFVASGYAMVHPGSIADICAVEAVPVEQIDPEAARKGLSEAQSALSSAQTDYDKAVASIGVEVFSAMEKAAA
mmetsp:Transcript_13962/g.50823  ORF Transcript_13962/g.50823 Transcript_13962/m.50823 type:complete len:192 (-) Transcript_13962:1006-1581(-)